MGNNMSSPTLRGGDARHDRLSPPANDGNDFYEVPPADFYAARDVQNRPKPFDFNSQAPNPWARPEPQPEPRREPEPRRRDEPAFEEEIEIRLFDHCREDRELRAYLASRSISLGFLREIDQFFQGHPEIATCAEGRSTLQQLNTLSPLDAYKYFLKGYTRPARYVDGIVRTDAFTIPPNFSYQALSSKRDPELIDFFDGFEYRHDIIERIDNEVYTAVKELARGQHINTSLRKLVCYAVWGNPVDAYKWYEYHYQTEYLPHKYLPEHVVLGHIPKPTDQADPRPSVFSGPLKHRDVRTRMARANDQGVDVLEVLIAEYRIALVRRAHRRVEIDDLVAKAKQRLDQERQDPTGVDIVDFIMDDAVSRRGSNTRARQHPRNNQSYRSFKIGSARFQIYGGNFSYTVTRAGARRGGASYQASASELCQARATLLRLYMQEQNIIADGGYYVQAAALQMVRASRATAERRYVNCLIRYCRETNSMTAWEATQLQKDFTRQKMGNLGVSNGNYLLGLFPRELY